MTANKTIFLSFVLFLLTSRAFTAENRVLELDGGGSYVELPADISAALDAIWRDEILARFGLTSYQALCEALA